MLIVCVAEIFSDSLNSQFPFQSLNQREWWAYANVAKHLNKDTGSLVASSSAQERMQSPLKATVLTIDSDDFKHVFLKVNSHFFKLYRAYSISFNSSNFCDFFLELNSERLYRSSGKEKVSHCLVFTSHTKREIRVFLVVVVQWRQRNIQMYKKAWCTCRVVVLSV